MLEVYRDLCVDPTYIGKFVVAHGEITVVLRVHHGCISSLINTREGIIIPYLIISDAALSVYLALKHRLVNGDSVDFCNADEIVSNIDIHAFLRHHELLSKF